MSGPTPKQLKFAEAIVSGLDPLEAYEAAGYKVGNRATASREAQRLMNHPTIAPIIEDGRRRAMNDAIWTRSLELERMRVVNDQAMMKIEEGDISANTVKVFMETCDRLHAMTGLTLEDEVKQVIFNQASESFGADAFMKDPMAGLKAAEEFDARRRS